MVGEYNVVGERIFVALQRYFTHLNVDEKMREKYDSSTEI